MSILQHKTISLAPISCGSENVQRDIQQSDPSQDYTSQSKSGCPQPYTMSASTWEGRISPGVPRALKQLPMQGSSGSVERARIYAHLSTFPRGDSGQLREADVIANTKTDTRKVYEEQCFVRIRWL